MVTNLEIELLANRHREPGYFSLDGVELSKAECVAIDTLGMLIFIGVHRLIDLGRLPATIQGLAPEQLDALRAEVVSIASQVLVSEANGDLPVSVTVEPSGSTFTLRSKRVRDNGPQGPASAPRHEGGT